MALAPWSKFSGWPRSGIERSFECLCFPAAMRRVSRDSKSETNERGKAWRRQLPPLSGLTLLQTWRKSPVESIECSRNEFQLKIVLFALSILSNSHDPLGSEFWIEVWLEDKRCSLPIMAIRCPLFPNMVCCQFCECSESQFLSLFQQLWLKLTEW